MNKLTFAAKATEAAIRNLRYFPRHSEFPLTEFTSPHHHPRFGYVSVYFDQKRRRELTALIGFHFLVMAYLALNHAWYKYARSPSLLEQIYQPTAIHFAVIYSADEADQLTSRKITPIILNENPEDLPQ